MTFKELLNVVDGSYTIRLRWYSVGSDQFYNLDYSKDGKNDFVIKSIRNGTCYSDLCCYIDDKALEDWFSEYSGSKYKMRKLI